MIVLKVTERHQSKVVKLFLRIDEECFYFDGLLMLRWAKTFHDHHYHHDHHCASTLMPLVLYARSVCVMFRPRLVTEYCYWKLLWTATLVAVISTCHVHAKSKRAIDGSARPQSPFAGYIYEEPKQPFTLPPP
ncbi:hypothetical protein PV325_008776, partial [Microctonus aethiopoides]